MNIERYTQKAQSLLQAAQTLALGSGHQKFLPEHLLEVMLEDQEDLAQKLISFCDANIEILKAENKSALKRIPRVEGSGASGISMSQEMARVLMLSEKISDQNLCIQDCFFETIFMKWCE